MKRSYKSIRRAPVEAPLPRFRGASWVMTLTMVVVTLWSAADGNRGPGTMAAASVAAVAAMNVLAYVGAMLPQTRPAMALVSALWIVVFMPGWDWLSGQFSNPETWYSAAGFGAAFGLLRYVMMRNGSARRPW